jgi:hypothetical protein
VSLVLGLNVACFQATEQSVVHPLDDGLLVLGGDSLRALSAEWTLIVAVDSPEPPTNLLEEIQNLKTATSSNYVLRNVDNGTVKMWRQQLERMESQVLSFGMLDHRHKRSILGFLGPVFQTVFGLVTENEMQEYRRAIQENRHSQQRVTHKVNEMISIINQTNQYVQQNRGTINNLVNYTQALTSKLNHVITQSNTVLLRVNSAILISKIIAVMLNLETVTKHYVELKQHHQQQRASLELGHLTEELLPVRELPELLQQATTHRVEAVHPLEWYYQSVTVVPMWNDGQTLVYRATLPLVDHTHYLRYHLHTWKQPYNTSGYSARLVVAPDVALDTNSGTIFVPHSCIGMQPEVCRTGPQYNQHLGQCPRGILLEQRALRKHCQIQLAFENSTTVIDEVNSGEFVMVTWGEICVLHCRGKLEKQYHLLPGVYLLSVPENCTIAGQGWTLPGIIRRTVQKSVKSHQVLLTVPLDMTQIVDEVDVIHHLQQRVTAQLEPIAAVTLSKLDTPIPLLDWSAGKTFSWESIMLIVVLVVTPLALATWYFRRYLCRKPTMSIVSRGQETVVPEGTGNFTQTSETPSGVPLVPFTWVPTTETSMLHNTSCV